MGRAISQAGTVRIGAGGLARLSPDLFIRPRLVLLGFDHKTRLLRLQTHTQKTDWGLKVYKSAPGSRSGTVSMMAVLKMYGLQSAIGKTFAAELVKDVMVVDFSKAMNGGSK